MQRKVEGKLFGTSCFLSTLLHLFIAGCAALIYFYIPSQQIEEEPQIIAFEIPSETEPEEIEEIAEEPEEIAEEVQEEEYFEAEEPEELPAVETNTEIIEEATEEADSTEIEEVAVPETSEDDDFEEEYYEIPDLWNTIDLLRFKYFIISQSGSFLGGPLSVWFVLKEDSKLGTH